MTSAALILKRAIKIDLIRFVTWDWKTAQVKVKDKLFITKETRPEDAEVWLLW